MPNTCAFIITLLFISTGPVRKGLSANARTCLSEWRGR
jgi:hypothetical protein